MAELDPSIRFERAIESMDAERGNDWLIFGLLLAAGAGISGLIWHWLDHSLISGGIRNTVFLSAVAFGPASVWVHSYSRKTRAKFLPALANLHGLTYAEKMISLRPFIELAILGSKYYRHSAQYWPDISTRDVVVQTYKMSGQYGSISGLILSQLGEFPDCGFVVLSDKREFKNWDKGFFNSNGPVWQKIEDVQGGNEGNYSVYARTQNAQQQDGLQAMLQTISLGQTILGDTANFRAAFQEKERLAMVFEEKSVGFDRWSFFATKRRRARAIRLAVEKIGNYRKLCDLLIK